MMGGHLYLQNGQSSSPSHVAPISTLDASIEGVVRASSVSTSSSVVRRPPTVNRIPENLPVMLLNPQAIAERIFARMPNAEIDDEVYAHISNAAESRLRHLLTQLAVLAEHRLESLRQNTCYKQIDDPRKQLRFMADIDKAICERRQALEREAILRLTKSKGKDKDTLEKAKQIQKADREATVNRETNAAAFAALGGLRSGLKRNNVPEQNGVGGLQSSQTPLNRPLRAKRITMHDLQFLLNSGAFTSIIKPAIRHRMALSSLNIDNEANTTSTI